MVRRAGIDGACGFHEECICTVLSMVVIKNITILYIYIYIYDNFQKIIQVNIFTLGKIFLISLVLRKRTKLLPSCMPMRELHDLSPRLQPRRGRTRRP